jgi:hypothetical protein
MATDRKSTAREGMAKKASAASRDHASEGAPRKRRPRSMRTVAARAAGELTGLIGRQAEGVVGVEQVDHGWRVQIEVVESRRIPDTTDILAIYEVEVDADGEVTAYRRLSQYVRGRLMD